MSYRNTQNTLLKKHHDHRYFWMLSQAETNLCILNNAGIHEEDKDGGWDLYKLKLKIKKKQKIYNFF